MTVYGHQRHGSLSKATHLSLTEALVCVAVDKKQGSLFSNFPTKGSSIMLGGTGIQHVYFLSLSFLVFRVSVLDLRFFISNFWFVISNLKYKFEEVN